MPGVALELPTIQNWSCHNCSGCCRQHGIHISEADKLRIEQQDWSAEGGIPEGQPVFVKMGGWLTKAWWRLAHQPDGACVFLDQRGLCRIHAKFGEEAKPLACRIYPYAFHPAGKKVAVSLRYSCPSVVKNLGTPVPHQAPEIRRLARQVVPEGAVEALAPNVTAVSQLEWPDVLRIVRALDETFAAEGASVLVKLLRALVWIALVEQATFDKIAGDRLAEFLAIITDAARGEVPDDISRLLAAAPAPSRAGRVQFRLLAGHYARDDKYTSARGAAARWRLLMNGVRLARGKGNMPAVQECFSEVPFEALDAPFGGVPPEAEEIFTRYFRVKIQGLHFLGRAYYDVPLVEGFYSLALVYPVVLWLARWLAVSDGRRELSGDDVARGLAIADHHHGYSPALGTWSFRRRVQTLAQLEDVPRLCVWYSR